MIRIAAKLLDLEPFFLFLDTVLLLAVPELFSKAIPGGQEDEREKSLTDRVQKRQEIDGVGHSADGSEAYEESCVPSPAARDSASSRDAASTGSASSRASSRSSRDVSRSTLNVFGSIWSWRSASGQ